MAENTVRFIYSDGKEARVEVPPGSSIQAAALAAGIPLLNQCRSGTCGTCVAKLISGEVTPLKGSCSSLLKSEHVSGLRLTCISEAASDCTFALDYPRSLGEVRPQKANAFIDTIDWIAPNVVRLALELAEGDDLAFRPGQFVQMTIPGTNIRRSYSMSSAPDALPKLEFLIRVLPTGVMSDYLRGAAAVDDVIELEGAFGSFYWREAIRKPHIMIAGGTGLAPMMSIIDSLRKAPGRKPPVLLTFGCPDNQSLFYLDQLESRRFWMPNLKTRITIDKGIAEGDIAIGNPVSAVSADDIVDPETIAYLCGPPRMIEASHAHLISLGVKPENIHAEQFLPSN